ncbi:MAG: hypothetical protein KDG50_02325 [Chromatiales bacterium]|nr:hypothetical protein [Chromatiales bacterium]
MNSLHHRLFSILGALAVIVWTVVLVIAAVMAGERERAHFDAELARLASSLAGGGLNAEATPPEPDHPRLRVSVHRATGDPQARNGRIAFDCGPPGTPRDISLDGEPWRCQSVAGADGTVAAVASPIDLREARAADELAHSLWPIVLGLPLSIVALWLGIPVCLGPLNRVAREISARDADHLDPVQMLDTPREIRPLVAELNRLLSRLEEVFSRSSRFASDAAHELRAPVTAIRAQAEAGLAAATDAEQRQSLEQILGVANTCSGLVEQILVLARLEPEVLMDMGDEVDLQAAAQSVLGLIAPAAFAKDIELSYDESGPASVHGNAELVRVLLHNLLDNAIRCTPIGGDVRISIRADARSIGVSVEDTGPGIPAADRERVLQRFCQLPESVGAGYGIGLSIVERIAHAHDAHIALDDGPNGRGLRVSVRFPRP